MFILTKQERGGWKYQIGTSGSSIRLSLRKPPLAFTEQRVAMLSSVLHSKRAIRVNIQIIRIFTKLRQIIHAYKELRERIEEMEQSNEVNFKEVFKIIRYLLREDETHLIF